MIDLTERASMEEEPTKAKVVRPGSSFKELWRQTWDLSPKPRPTDEEAERALERLRDNWSEIAGQVAGNTFPKCFSGPKLRKLIVQVTGEGAPPWGGWDFLAVYHPKRRSFTILRAEVNDAIGPHEVDHIEFQTG